MRGSLVFWGGFRGRNKRRNVLLLGFRGMSFESESSLEPGVFGSVGGTSGNGQDDSQLTGRERGSEKPWVILLLFDGSFFIINTTKLCSS